MNKLIAILFLILLSVQVNASSFTKIGGKLYQVGGVTLGQGGTPIVPPEPPSVDTNLMLWYEFNTSNTIQLDSGYIGTNVGTVSGIPVWYNSSESTESSFYELDGVALNDQWISASKSSDIESTGAITVSCWARRHYTLDARAMMGKWSATSTEKQYLLLGNSHILVRFYIHESDQTELYCGSGHNQIQPIGMWRMYTGVADPETSSIYLYVNGILMASNSYDGTLNSDIDVGLSIGKMRPADSTYDWYGGIDDARVYNRALSSNELYQLCLTTRTNHCWQPWMNSNPELFNLMDYGVTMEDRGGQRLTDVCKNDLFAVGNNPLAFIFGSGSATPAFQNNGLCGWRHFDGVDDYAYIAEGQGTISANIPTEPYYVSMWFRTSEDYSSEAGYLIDDSWGNRRWTISVNTNNKINLFLSDTGLDTTNFYSTNVVNDGMWHNIQWQSSNTIHKLWLDNDLISDVNAPNVNPVNPYTGAFPMVGANGINTNNLFNGDIDDLLIYLNTIDNTILSDADRLIIYEGGFNVHTN